MAFNGVTISCPGCGEPYHFGSLEVATRPRLSFACDCGSEVSVKNDTPAALDAIDEKLDDLMSKLGRDILGRH